MNDKKVVITIEFICSPNINRIVNVINDNYKWGHILLPSDVYEVGLNNIEFPDEWDVEGWAELAGAVKVSDIKITKEVTDLEKEI